MFYVLYKRHLCVLLMFTILTLTPLCSLFAKLLFNSAHLKYQPLFLPSTVLLLINIDWDQKPSYFLHPLKDTHTNKSPSQAFNFITFRPVEWKSMCSPLVLLDVKSDSHERFLKTAHMSKFKGTHWVSQPKRKRTGRGWGPHILERLLMN